jgi:glycosyltransferase involved in cell wall biosynthesis
MKIILFSHPSFMDSQSMPRYANMLSEGMLQRGHQVEIWSPKARLYTFPIKVSLKKWLGYLDQYLVFPIEVKLKLRNCSKDTLFVFADQALGPWVPLVKNRFHVVHCHDFLALKSAMGTIPENPTSYTGKKYQNYIKNGFSKGKNFISISQKTKEDLEKFHRGTVLNSTVCYNGLNRFFESLNPIDARSLLAEKLNLELANRYIMHIGGNQYYKNRKGVLEIYEAWRSTTDKRIPLVLIGSAPTDELANLHQKSQFKNDIHFITDLSDEFINNAYSGAACLLFPSLDEGFGWPIVEAMASGCLVITTKEAPMTEVGGEAAFYIEKRPFETAQVEQWKIESATLLDKVVLLKAVQRNEVIEMGLTQSKKFTSGDCLDSIEKFYKKITLE